MHLFNIQMLILYCNVSAETDEMNGDSSSSAVKMKLPDHLQPNSTLVFSVTVIEAADISPQYSDVFCQFK